MSRRLYNTALTLGALASLASVACASSLPKDDVPLLDTPPKVTSIEVAELEISGSTEDRFVSCPPAGELGQTWIPPIPAWSPPSDPGVDSRASSKAALFAQEHSAQERREERDEGAQARRMPGNGPMADTLPDFRDCHYRGQRLDPTQDGHVAIVARVGPDGEVAKVEEYGACNLSSEVIACMRARTTKLHFDPPASGSLTVTIPAYFAPQDGFKRGQPTQNDAYTAMAYVAIEQARPQLHVCETAARASGGGIEASATMNLTVDAHGRVTALDVDPFTGNRDLLMCAAQAFHAVQFGPPPAGRGKVLARVVFNPRAGTR